jgi:hypothetical protein
MAPSRSSPTRIVVFCRLLAAVLAACGLLLLGLTTMGRLVAGLGETAIFAAVAAAVSGIRIPGRPPGDSTGTDHE